MRTVSVATLKQQLSSYLHQVEEGEEIVVTAHRRPVAQVIPVAPQNLRVRRPASGMAALRQVKGARMSEGRTAVEMLIEDRYGR